MPTPLSALPQRHLSSMKFSSPLVELALGGDVASADNTADGTVVGARWLVISNSIPTPLSAILQPPQPR